MLLRRHREAAGLTQEALAERAGVSARAVSALERGVNRAPRPSTLGLLTEAMGLPPRNRAALARAARRGGPSRALVPGARPSPAAGARPAAPVAGGLGAAGGAGRHNLPRPLTSFVGRDRELAAVREALARHPLVTLTGAGG